MDWRLVSSLALIFPLLVAPLAASYSNLLSPADGAAVVVVVQAKTGIRTTQWHEVRR